MTTLLGQTNPLRWHEALSAPTIPVSPLFHRLNSHAGVLKGKLFVGSSGLTSRPPCKINSVL